MPTDLRAKLEEILRDARLEPMLELVTMVMETNAEGRHVLTQDQRIKVLLELQQYRMPKLRSMEVRAEVDMTVNVKVVRFGDEANQKNPVLEAEVLKEAVG